MQARFLVLADFIACLRPEKPRDIKLPASPYARSKIAIIVNGVYILPLHEQVSLINVIF